MEKKNPAFSNKSNRLIVDFSILFTFVLLIITGIHGTAAHIALGILIIPLCVAHLLLNKKWITNTISNLSKGKLIKKTKYLLTVNTCLTIIFTVIIVTGVALSCLGIASGNIMNAFHHFGKGNPPSTYALLHSLMSKIGILFIFLHIKAHWKYIISSFKRAMIPHNNKLSVELSMNTNTAGIVERNNN